MILKQLAIKLIMLGRFIKSEPNFIAKLRELKAPGKKALLIGTPVHGNYGDHLIAAAEECFLLKHFSDYHFIDCTMPFTRYFFHRVIHSVDQEDLVFISGGGWLGSEWPENEQFVRDILKKLNNNLIVILPQTVHYAEADQFLKDGEKIYSNCKNLLFCVRDQRSYDFVVDKKLSERDRTVYMPDFALFYDTNIKHEIGNDNIGLCFRDDIEAFMKPERQRQIVDYISMTGYKCSNITTNEKGIVIPLRDRITAINSKLREISQCQLLITDRLHAMIIAALTCTPCIAYDNSTHKVEGVHRWIQNRNDVILLSDNDDPTVVIDFLLKKTTVAEGPILSNDWLDKLEQKIRDTMEVL